MSYHPELSRFKEVREIEEIIRGFPRSSKQLNSPFVSDAEILELDPGTIALTLDIVSEEYELGLLRDPQTLGWVAVTASLSDLAAVGADPIGVLMGLNLPRDLGGAFGERVFQGIDQSVRRHSTYVLGGDTGEAESFQISCLAVGKLDPSRRLSRVGARPGDRVYLTGPVGWGNAVGFANYALSKHSPELTQRWESEYRPVARLAAGRILAGRASSALDTSDGLIAALDLMAEISDVSIAWRWDEGFLHPVAREVAIALKVPPILFAGCHNGEFELLFTASDEMASEISSKLQAFGLRMFQIGEIEEGRAALRFADRPGAIDLSPIRNLLADGASPEAYIQAQIAFAARLSAQL